MPTKEPQKLPVEFSSSESSSSDSETSLESDGTKEIHSIKHSQSQSERFDESKYLTETSIEIDYKKSFIEDLESLFPLRAVEIRENRDSAKEFSDMDKNYPFDPIPNHVLRFFVYSPTDRLLFKASHRALKKRNRFWTNYVFDTLFILPEGQFVFEVKRRTTFGSHLLRSSCFGNSAVVSTGDFGTKYLGRINQVFSLDKKRRFVIEDSNARQCLTVEAPKASWAITGPPDKMIASLEFKFPNGKLFATLDFKGNYSRPRISRKCPMKWPSFICMDSTAIITFEETDIREPVELRAFIFGAYILFYHQYWEYKRVGCCPLIIVYVICCTLFGLIYHYFLSLHI